MAIASKYASTCTSTANPSYGGTAPWASASNAQGAPDGSSSTTTVSALDISEYLRCVFSGFSTIAASKINSATLAFPSGTVVVIGGTTGSIYVDHTSTPIASNEAIVASGSIPSLSLTLTTPRKTSIVSGITLDVTTYADLSATDFSIDSVRLDVDYIGGNRKKKMVRRVPHRS